MNQNKLWEILKKMGILDHLIFILRNLYVGQETTVRTLYGMTSSKLGKEYDKAIYYHPVYFTYIQNTSCKTPASMKKKLASRLQGEINKLR